MSVLIRGMEMPKTCHECRLYEGDIYYCSAADKEIDISDSSEGKCQFCPLVQVPPHGRLIDADELHKLFIKKGKEFKGIGGAMLAAAAWCIANAPTVIEAEEGE